MIGDRGGIPPEFYKQVHKAVKSAKVSWDGGDSTVGDIVSLVWIYLLERPNQISKILDMTPDERRQTLAWIAHRACAEEYEDFLQYCGNNLYEREDVMDMLKRGSLYQKVEGHHWLPHFIHEAMERMKHRDKVRDEHHRGTTEYVDEIWARYGPEGSAPPQGRIHKHLVDALTRLTIEVNRAVRRHDTGR